MSDLRITEAFLYMDYLVGAGRGWRVASRISRWPVAPRLELQPLGWLSFFRRGCLGLLSPRAGSEGRRRGRPG